VTAGEGTSRCRRQRDELRGLCRDGLVTRAIDLAFEHFSDYGRDDEVVALLADALDRVAVDSATIDRFAALRATG
jgi:hypothetical protein